MGGYCQKHSPCILVCDYFLHLSLKLYMMELIDNPIDYRRGRQLTIDVTVDKRAHRIEVLDYGGEGMDEAGLRDWIQWGTGHTHLDSDIGQWHDGKVRPPAGSAVRGMSAQHLWCRLQRAERQQRVSRDLGHLWEGQQGRAESASILE